MKNYILSIIMLSFIFSIGDTPNKWKMPDTYQFSNKSIEGIWSINVELVVNEFKETEEYKQAGEYGEISVQMIEQIFSKIEFIFQNDGKYLISGIENTNKNSSFEGYWYKENDVYYLESPDPKVDENLIFKLINYDVLQPLNEGNGYFHLIRNK